MDHIRDALSYGRELGAWVGRVCGLGQLNWPSLLDPWERQQHYRGPTSFRLLFGRCPEGAAHHPERRGCLTDAAAPTRLLPPMSRVLRSPRPASIGPQGCRHLISVTTLLGAGSGTVGNCQ